MKRLLLAIIVLLVLVTMGVGGTLAGLSDTESSREVFAAGSLDLRVAKTTCCWQPWDGEDFDFQDDEPHGDGLVPAFDKSNARLWRVYYSRHLLWNVGTIDGMAYLHIRIEDDPQDMAGTSPVMIWFDANGNEELDRGETKLGTLEGLACQTIELGLLPACEPRRLTLTVLPILIPEDDRCWWWCWPPQPSFSLDFDTEFQLIQANDCQAFTDTETCFNHIANIGWQGCSHGFWKNHLCRWWPTGYSPSQTVESVFDIPEGYPSLANATLYQALQFNGGDDLEGGARILLQQAVAAVLNAAHPRVNYPRPEGDVITDVNVALASGDRATMVALAEALDTDNNLGCPLGWPFF